LLKVGSKVLGNVYFSFMRRSGSSLGAPSCLGQTFRGTPRCHPSTSSIALVERD
jgi:hypothetical protein